MDRLLPGMEADLSKEMGRSLKKRKIPFHLNSKALRYEKTGDGLVVDIKLARREDDFRIEFSDYGVGVAPEILPRLFDAFVTSARGKGGTGLGMAIAQNIVSNLMGGAITCTSEIGEGTSFVIDVPTVIKGTPQEAFSAGIRA